MTFASRPATKENLRLWNDSSNEFLTRSNVNQQRVSRSFRRAPRSFQIRNSRSRSTEDGQPPCSASTTTREQRKRTQRRSATMFAVFLLCVLRAKYDFLFDTKRAVQHITRQCTTMTENKCCASMACGWCVAQTLILTRVAKTTSNWRLTALPTAHSRCQGSV